MIWTILATVNLICALLAYSFLAYALARLRWNGRGIALVLLAVIVCAQIWIVPQLISLFVLRVNAVLYWIWFADWLVCAFAIVLLWESFKGAARDRADAARLDGCGPLGIYWHIVVPLVKRVLLLLALVIVMATIGGILVHMSEMFRAEALHVIVPNLSFLMVCSVIMTIPLIVIFFFARKLRPPAPESVRLV